MEHNKLVRDKIPDIIRTTGEEALTRILPDDEYKTLLERKLDEEVCEYHESRELEELADILEVVYALCEVHGNSIEELTSVYQKKHKARGGFAEKVFLISTTVKG
ncbi:MAG: nucleoside triphosphate pyrophosphohydrolase [Clostridiaceae bacterium]|nr:nucleoside triphosphate pyrophosphohydrolase [Clostridiaceae bacterium]